MSRIITDARALDAQFVPRELHHREAAIDELRSALRPVVDGYPANDICLYGPAGVGKTTLAKYMLSQLEQSAPAVRWGYVNCIRTSGQRNVLHELVHDIDVDVDLSRRGTDSVTDDDRLRAIDDPVIAIVDEARCDTRERYLSLLHPEQRLLFDIIDDAGEIPVHELHSTYEELSEDPRSRSMRRRYLQSLERYRLVESSGRTRATTYQSLTN